MSDTAELLAQFKTDVENDYDATDDQRRAQNEDIRFISVDGGMWEDFLTDTHNSETKRARLELDITSDAVFSYVGERTLNRASVIYTPDDKATTDDDADLLNGVYRADFKDNDGQVSQDNSVLETAMCGSGAFKFSTRFVDEEDPENENQEIIFEPIFNAFSHVVFDANAKRADKADAKHVTVLTGYNEKAFESEWPELEATSAYEPEQRFSWKENDVVYVGERYEIEKVKEKVQVWQNVQLNKVKAYNVEQFAAVEDELKALGWEFVRERTITRQKVKKSVFTGAEFIEEPKLIAGKYLPVIPMSGFRIYVNNEEHTRGIVRKLKDANRAFNAAISKMAESSASSGDSKNTYVREQVKGCEDNLARKDKAYNVINALKDVNGNPILSGPVDKSMPNQVDPNTVAVMEVISSFVQNKTGGMPQDTIDPNASGKAINALRTLKDLNTQVMTDNINQSLKHAGKVYRSIAGDIYTKTQMKKVVGINGQSKIVQLNQTSLDPQSGNPIALNDLSRGKFSVDVEVGPQYESQKEATIDSIERVMDKLDRQDPLFAPLLSMWMSNIEGTGLDPIKEFNRNLMLKQGLVQPETQEEEQMLQSVQQQKDPQEELTLAAAEQQRAEAKNLEASSVQKLADAQLKKAQAVEKVVDIGIKRTEQTLRRLQGIQTGQSGANVTQ
ncbi:hypothetical protein MNBD_GAMMA01-1335 [hydrothermal vent metagenome]|uniref:Phage P22-like portal protein n=1 Tax=hydrothermal vent metagenome TaxID=652676 RepID=A0A3B0V5V6_9ZZZZ